jgi:hypothetical protein
MRAGILGHHLNRGADDPNMIYAYFPATDVDKLKAFLDSPNLADAMKKAGVESTPTMMLMKPMSTDFTPGESHPGIIVKHAVEDYDRWRAGYDAFDDYRRQAGIVGHAVNQEIGNPNQVIVYHQAKDLATLRAFVESNELKEKMQEAGVASAPEIHFVESDEFGDYSKQTAGAVGAATARA